MLKSHSQKMTVARISARGATIQKPSTADLTFSHPVEPHLLPSRHSPDPNQPKLMNRIRSNKGPIYQLMRKWETIV
jgi:hypothetical protein